MQLSGQNLAPTPLLNGIINDRPAFAHVDIDLQPGQQVLSDAGAMIWMDQKLDVKTDCGECMPACWRTCSGEACCQNTYTGPGRIAFSFKLPGDMLPFGVAPNGGGWIVNSGAFICGSANIEVTCRFSSFVACCCGGENPFITKIISKDGQNGMFYAGGYGAITRHEIPEGKTFCLDNGLFFAANEACPFELALPGGVVGWCYGGEGFTMRFKGPAVVYSQNRDPSIWKRLLKPRPNKKQKNAVGGGVSV
jgi:uncharacterized protein (TIGR00266 family)